MNQYESNELIKILFYSDVILNNNKKNIDIKNDDILIKHNLMDNNIFTQYYNYNNNKLSIYIDNIQHIKNIYNLNNNDISNIITYFFINDIFKIPDNKTCIDEEYINILNNKINNLNCEIEKNSKLKIGEFNKKLSEYINLSYNTEQLYNPYNNILGHIIYNNEYYIYDEIIQYTSEKYLSLNEPILKKKIKTYEVFNEIILNMLNVNYDITSYNIKKNIDKFKNIEYNIETILPYYIINYFKPKNIINIENDYGQWLYISKILNINKLITINQYKFDDDTIKNIETLNNNNINFKSVDYNYMYDDTDIDLIYYNCNFLHEHSNHNITNILYNECFYKLTSSWDQLNDKGYLLINLHDYGNKKITELVNLYINKLHNSEYIGILCIHKKKNIYPIWVYKKNINNKQINQINDIFNEQMYKI